MIVLVINTGSSSVKYRLYRMPEALVIAAGSVEPVGSPDARLACTHKGTAHNRQVDAPDHDRALELIFETLSAPIAQCGQIAAAGHRVVHGADEFTGSVIIDDSVIASLERYSDLAPLHNPVNLTGIRAARRHFPDALQVACFDTAFHTTIPPTAFTYALPRELCEQHGIRRYGFHGTSHRFAARRAADMLGLHKYAVNAVTCHLGGGCSITAVKNGRSVDTSMGFTSLEGLVMGTRSGDFDPAIIFYLLDKGWDAASIASMCNKQSGLLGLSGVSGDMRTLAALAAQGDAGARLAVDVFCYRVKKYIGAYAAVLDTVHALVFTGGIGENAPDVRAAICTGLTGIGIELDPHKNAAAAGAEAVISGENSRIKVLVVPADEEGAIAKDTFELAVGIAPTGA